MCEFSIGSGVGAMLEIGAKKFGVEEIGMGKDGVIFRVECNCGWAKLKLFISRMVSGVETFELLVGFPTDVPFADATKKKKVKSSFQQQQYLLTFFSLSASF